MLFHFNTGIAYQPFTHRQQTLSAAPTAVVAASPMDMHVTAATALAALSNKWRNYFIAASTVQGHPLDYSLATSTSVANIGTVSPSQKTSVAALAAAIQGMYFTICVFPG